MKTTISIPEDLLEEIEKEAKERRSSRDEVFVAAVREYLRKKKSKKLLEVINKASAAAETAEESNVRQESKKRYGRIL